MSLFYYFSLHCLCFPSGLVFIHLLFPFIVFGLTIFIYPVSFGWWGETQNFHRSSVDFVDPILLTLRLLSPQSDQCACVVCWKTYCLYIPWIEVVLLHEAANECLSFHADKKHLIQHFFTNFVLSGCHLFQFFFMPHWPFHWLGFLPNHFAHYFQTCSFQAHSSQSFPDFHGFPTFYLLFFHFFVLFHCPRLIFIFLQSLPHLFCEFPKCCFVPVILSATFIHLFNPLLLSLEYLCPSKISSSSISRRSSQKDSFLCSSSILIFVT